MYIVVKTDPDGDSYMVTHDEIKARSHFETEVKTSTDSVFADSKFPITLAKINEGNAFTSGSDRNLHGCEVIEIYYPVDV